MIHSVTMEDGDWNTHGSIRSWDYTCNGKKEVFKERREYDDEKMAVTQIAVGGHVMDLYKVYYGVFHFIPKPEKGCVCKVNLVWEKISEDSPEPINYMAHVKKMVTGVDDHIVNGQNSA
ncbi:unnamed protein product [Thlaspi arvense]|uniref:Bet v I/Major latex protein domain-containing protein n=1 Tax=Thlaspi arvense TaxID=13288 RepID=A0AAU9SSY6_THLAR|nr:unnamed protein product [Thlaspi arvense]